MTHPVRTDWQPRYLAYCRAHGTPDPDAMLARDSERWPGGCMTGYILWINERWREWRASRGMPGTDLVPVTEQEHAEFTEWLS